MFEALITDDCEIVYAHMLIVVALIVVKNRKPIYKKHIKTYIKTYI